MLLNAGCSTVLWHFSHYCITNTDILLYCEHQYHYTYKCMCLLWMKFIKWMHNAKSWLLIGIEFKWNLVQAYPADVSPVYIFPVDCLLVFNTQTSWNVHISQYSVFWLMFV